MRREHVEADLVQVLERGRERDGAEHVRRARLVALGRAVPLDVLERDRRRRAAAPDVRRARLEEAHGRDEHARAERREQLVAREGAVVDAERGELERAMRRELGGVDAELGTGLVREPRPERDVRHVARHVRGARDGHELDASAQRVEQRREVVDVGRAVLEQAHVAVVHPAPGQQVRVVLRGGREHDRALAVLVQQQPRDLVQPVRRVPREDDRLIGTRADEAVHRRARPLVGVGRDAGADARRRG